jgi:hypothetical protein
MRHVIEKTWGWDEAWQQRDFDRRFDKYLVSVIDCEGRAAGGVVRGIEGGTPSTSTNYNCCRNIKARVSARPSCSR